MKYKKHKILVIKNNRARGWFISKALIQEGYDVVYLTNLSVKEWDRINIKKNRGKIIGMDYIEGIKVIAVPILNISWLNRNFIAKLIMRLSFSISLFLSLPFIHSIDAIINCNPHPFTDFFTIFLKKIKGSKSIIDISDYELESIKKIKINKVLFQIMNILGYILLKIFYNKSDVIITHTTSVKKIMSRYTNKPQYTLYNSINTNRFKPLSKKIIKNTLPIKFKNLIYTQKKLFMYVGKYGPIQNLTKILKLAKQIYKFNSNLFIFVGEGEDEYNLKKYVKENSIKNVIFFDYQPWNIIPYIINLSDACLVSLADDALWSMTIPSKFFEYAACGKAIIGLCPEGEVTNLINKWQCGVTYSSTNLEEFAKIVNNLVNNKELLHIMGKNARNMAENLFSLKNSGNKLNIIIESTLNINRKDKE